MTHGPDPTVEVPRPIMRMGWEELTFVHWAYDPATVQRLLPPGLSVHLFDDRAWVSLVPFTMRVRFPVIGEVPWLSVFPETNVRTYVTAADGTEGIWFFSLDASRLAAVTAARIGYRLPYMWSRMSVELDGDGAPGSMATYDCVRRFPGPRGASSGVTVRIGAALGDRLAERDHFLSARWRLYSQMFGAGWGARAHHLRWPLHAAELLRYDDQLITAAGLPTPTGDPIVQYSPGVDVSVSIPRRTRPATLEQPAG